jgi:hypothetical protein
VALYTLEEFASYVQSDVDTATADLLRELVTGLIEAVDGHDYQTDVPSAAAKAVGLQAAARAYRNPGGISSQSEAIDDYSVTNRWESQAAEMGLFLTDSELARLRGVARNRSVVLQLPS